MKVYTKSRSQARVWNTRRQGPKFGGGVQGGHVPHKFTSGGGGSGVEGTISTDSLPYPSNCVYMSINPTWLLSFSLKVCNCFALFFSLFCCFLCLYIKIFAQCLLVGHPYFNMGKSDSVNEYFYQGKHIRRQLDCRMIFLWCPHWRTRRVGKIIGQETSARPPPPNKK